MALPSLVGENIYISSKVDFIVPVEIREPNSMEASTDHPDDSHHKEFQGGSSTYRELDMH